MENWCIMNVMRDRKRTIEELKSWPLYGSLRDWCVITGYSDNTFRHAMRLGRLKGYIQNSNRWHFSRTQILRWLAPGLEREQEDVVGRLIEPGRDMEAR